MLHDIIKKGSVDRSVTLRIIDSLDGTPETGVVYNTSGIALWYRREGAAQTAITEATLAALTTAHTDGGFLHVGDGVYRLDLPDAAFATAANYVDFGGTVTGMICIGGRVRLVDVDLEDTVRMGMTALPNAAAAAAGGLFTRGTGAGQINQSANGQVDVNVAVMANNVLTAAAINADAITAAKVASDVGDEIATSVWAYVVENSLSALKLMRGFASALYGKASGLGTTSVAYRDLADSKNRIAATVDSDGNRTAVTTDLT